MRRGASVAALILLLSAPGATEARGQLTEPCGVACALVLGASSATFATGTMTAAGRLRGGFSTTGQAITSWSAGFLLSAGAGLALHGDGGRQRRAVYASGLGALGGAALGVALEAALGESTGTTRWAAALVGAAVGVAVGGALGAVSWEGPTGSAPSFQMAMPLGLVTR